MKKHFIASLVLILIISVTNVAEAAAEYIIINKGTNQLAFYQNDKLIKVFPAATGKDASLTPEGNFYIINKIVNPPYYKKNIPGGSPYNPLGPRWLGLSAPGGPFGIHGNNNPLSIGTYASAGCIRLYNQDILWLYDQVPVGTPVKIIRDNTDFRKLLAPERAALTINGSHAPKNCTAIILDDNVLVALRPVAEYLGYSVYWNSDNNINLEKNNTRAALEVGSQTASINGLEVNLTSAVKIWNNNIYVPKDFFNSVLGLKTTWQRHVKQLDLTDPAQYLPAK